MMILLTNVTVMPGIELIGSGMTLYGWLLLLAVFLIVELATVGLVSVWFAAGAAAAALVVAFGGGFVLQAGVFFAVSAVLIIATRPFAKRVINAHTVHTNADALIGQEIVIRERVDNLSHTGSAFAGGKEWTVRALEDGTVLEKGTAAEVVAISGVKLIVEAKK